MALFSVSDVSQHRGLGHRCGDAHRCQSRGRDVPTPVGGGRAGWPMDRTHDLAVLRRGFAPNPTRALAGPQSPHSAPAGRALPRALAGVFRSLLASGFGLQASGCGLRAAGFGALGFGFRSGVWREVLAHTGRRQTRRQSLTTWLLAIVLLAWWTPSISAQPQTGTLFGTVTTVDGKAVPGATVTLTGPGFRRTTIRGPFCSSCPAC